MMKSIFSFLQGHHRKVKKPAKQVRQPLFVASALRLSERLVGRLSDSTLRNYHTALHSFSDYLHQGDIPVNVLTSSHICGYADWLAARGVGLNTASCYLRSLRALYNRLATQRGLPLCRSLHGQRTYGEACGANGRYATNLCPAIARRE